MVKGFKDSKGKFHPINQSKGVRSRRDTSEKTKGVRLKRKNNPRITFTLLDKTENQLYKLRDELSDNQEQETWQEVNRLIDKIQNYKMKYYGGTGSKFDPERKARDFFKTIGIKTIYADSTFSVDVLEKEKGLSILVEADGLPYTTLHFKDSEASDSSLRKKGKLTKEGLDESYFDNGKFVVHIHKSDDNPPLGIIIDVWDRIDSELLDTATLWYDDTT